jgi:hypothetical protein
MLRIDLLGAHSAYSSVPGRDAVPCRVNAAAALEDTLAGGTSQVRPGENVTTISCGVAV